MQKYQTILDFNNSISTGLVPVLQSVVTAIPPFFSILLFTIFIFSAGSSYYTILLTTGKKRFWHSLTGSSFLVFLLSLLIVVQNTTSTIYLSGYWVGFYIMMILMSYCMNLNLCFSVT